MDAFGKLKVLDVNFSFRHFLYYASTTALTGALIPRVVSKEVESLVSTDEQVGVFDGKRVIEGTVKEIWRCDCGQ